MELPQNHRDPPLEISYTPLCLCCLLVLCLVTQSCLILCNPKDYGLSGSSVHGDSPGKNTGVGCHALLQGISPAQGSNLCLIQSPTLAVKLFTTSATWEAQSENVSHSVMSDS